MAQAIGESLPFAIGIALSPLPIVAVILVLITPRARANALAFLAGWSGGLLVVGGMLLAISGATDAASDSGNESTLAGVVKLVLGLLLLVLAARNWHTRPHTGADVELPRWLQALDRFTVPTSLGTGALLSSINPKNLALLLAGVAAISATGIGGGEQAGALVVFVLLASVTIVVPVGIYLVLGERADDVLAPAKDWLAQNNRAILAVILLIFGVKLLGDAISILS